MARNTSTFQIANRAGLKLTAELHELFVSTLRQTGRLSVAAGRCLVSPSTVREWLRKGRIEKAESPFKEFADDVERARAEFLAVAAHRMNQLAVGGVLTLPRYDKLNNLIHDEHGNVEWEERYFPPNVNALAHVLDRIDPQPNLEPQIPGLEAPPELTDAEAIAEAAKYFNLLQEGVQILCDLGCPPRQLLESFKDIEITATRPPAEPAKTEPDPEKPPDAF